MRVLVIEDDEEMARAIAVGLRRARLAADVAIDGHAGLRRAPSAAPTERADRSSSARGSSECSSCC